MSETEAEMAFVLKGLVEKVERMDRDLYDTSAARPGIAVRLDRIERLIAVLRWIGGGGLVGLAGTLYLLRRILEVLPPEAGGS